MAEAARYDWNAKVFSAAFPSLKHHRWRRSTPMNCRQSLANVSFKTLEPPEGQQGCTSRWIFRTVRPQCRWFFSRTSWDNIPPQRWSLALGCWWFVGSSQTRNFLGATFGGVGWIIYYLVHVVCASCQHWQSSTISNEPCFEKVHSNGVPLGKKRSVWHTIYNPRWGPLDSKVGP